MSRYEKLAKNSVIFAIGNFGSKFITIFMLPFYTSFLSQEEYGQIDIIITSISLLLPIFTVSIVEAIVRFSLEQKNYNYRDVLSNSIFIIILGIIILISLYPFISKISFLKEYILLFYIIFAMQAIHTSIKQFARSINLTKVFMLSDMLYSFLFVFFNIIFIYLFKMGVPGYFLSMILAYVIDILFLSLKTKVYKYINIRSLDKNKMKVMIIYCIPLIPNTIMWWVMNISDRYFITYYVGLGATGLYAVANKFPAIIANIQGVFFNAWQISAIEEYDKSKRDEFYSNIFIIFFFIMIIISSLYLIFNKLIVKILVSNDFYSSSEFAPILVLGVVFLSFSSFVGTNYVAMKQTKGAFYTSLTGAVTNIILNFLLIPKFGLYGASVATMLSFMMMWIFRIYDTRKIVRINYPVFKILITLILIFIQLFVGYLKISLYLSSIINITILSLIIYIGLDYIKEPFIILYGKTIKFLSRTK